MVAVRAISRSGNSAWFLTGWQRKKRRGESGGDALTSFIRKGHHTNGHPGFEIGGYNNQILGVPDGRI